MVPPMATHCHRPCDKEARKGATPSDAAAVVRSRNLSGTKTASRLEDAGGVALGAGIRDTEECIVAVLSKEGHHLIDIDKAIVGVWRTGGPCWLV
jgi:hypothetical protein